MPAYKKSYVFSRLVGLGVLCICAVICFWKIREEQKARIHVAEDAREKTRLLNIDANDVTRITLEQAHAQTFEIRKQGQGETAWMLACPKKVVAEASTIDALLHQWLDLRQIGEIAPDNDQVIDRQRFGFAPPRYTLTLETQGTNAHTASHQTLHFGKTNSFDGSVYVQRDTDPKIFRVSQSVVQSLQQDLFRLRDKRLAIFSAEDVIDIEVKPHKLDPGFKLHQIDATHAELQKPRRAVAKKSAFDDLARALASMHAKSFVAEDSSPQTLHRFGLGQPRFDVLLTLQDKTQYHLHIGEIQLHGQTYGFARLVADDAPVLELGSDWLLQKLREPAASYRDLRIAPVALDAIEKIHVRRQQEDITLVRAEMGEHHDTAWHDAADANKPLPQARVLGFLHQLTSLQATEVVDEKPSAKSLQRHGFTHPTLEVELYDSHDALLCSVILAAGQHQRGTFATTDSKTRIDMIASAQQQELENLWQQVVKAASDARPH